MDKLFLVVAAAWLVAYTKADIAEVVDCVSTLEDTWELQPHPTDCNSYIPCMNDVGVVYQCPDGLHFDAKRIVCDVPENAGCMPPTESPTTTEDDVTTVTEEPLNPCNALSEEGGEVAHSTNCTFFVNCVDQDTGHISFCPANLHFNALRQVCDIPERAQCLLAVCADQPDGLLASKNDCKRYIECKSSKATLRSCPEGEVFDESLQTCVTEDVSNRCQPQMIPLPPVEVTNTCTREVRSQLIGHPEYCDVYYRCINGVLAGRKCQSGLYFDERKSVCVLKEEHECTVIGDGFDGIID